MKDKVFAVEVDGQETFNLSIDDINNLDLIKSPDGQYHLIHDSRSIVVKVLKSDLNAKSYRLEINGTEYDIRVKNSLDLLIDKMGLSEVSSRKIQSIHAPMPGLILDLLVEVGQPVEEDTPLLILEAMKMENVIKSPRQGVISNIPARKGDAIEKNALLIEFEK